MCPCPFVYASERENTVFRIILYFGNIIWFSNASISRQWRQFIWCLWFTEDSTSLCFEYIWIEWFDLEVIFFSLLSKHKRVHSTELWRKSTQNNCRICIRQWHVEYIDIGEVRHCKITFNWKMNGVKQWRIIHNRLINNITWYISLCDSVTLFI